ncbi:MAG: UDP-N-acetylmuramate dehydrogenase [Lachnospiraceae bacterium]|nr:UDP-N-acetylmuramate dehydrogenase [Lachnospiraceae bacterium]
MSIWNREEIYEGLAAITGSDLILRDEPMSRHTTFRIGGPADYFAAVSTAEQVVKLVSFCKEREMPWLILGNGSNLLVADSGIRGLVIRLGKPFSGIEINGNEITADAGALLSATAAAACEAGLTGFEFAAGIPGTIGGACLMNAGAYGGEMKQVLISADVLGADGELRTVPAEEMGLAYRHSRFMESGDIILKVRIRLEEGDRTAIREQMDDLKGRRIEKQPLEYPSAGSTFKRPEGYFAGKLIMDAGLRGYTVGGAQVSEKHCGFVINRGGATAEDVMTLITDVQGVVMKQFGVELEPEVRLIGF